MFYDDSIYEDDYHENEEEDKDSSEVGAESEDEQERRVKKAACELGMNPFMKRFHCFFGKK